MPLILIEIFRKFWPFLLVLLVVGAVLGWLWSYGNTKYKAGYAAGDAGRILCEQSFKIEQANWVAEVQKQQAELAELAKRKQEVITKQVVVYRDRIKEVEVIKKETTDEIKANIKPTDVVIVPSAFVSVYNNAVEGSRVATGSTDKGRPEASRHSAGTIGQTTIFDATTFTEVVKGNVDAYNELAARYSKLVDLVEEINKL